MTPPLTEKELKKQYETYREMNLSLDLTRGKPSSDQLEFSNTLDGILDGDYFASDGTDTRNYGGLRGISEIRSIGGELLDVDPNLVIAGGNSSLQLMHFVMDSIMHYGLVEKAFSKEKLVKAICPVPGYDRHFNLTQSFGIEMVTVPMTEFGPDMEAIEKRVVEQPSCYLLWCVPKFSNPTGCTYSDSVVKQIAELPAKSKHPLYVLWDNAYAVHDFDSPPIKLANIFDYAADFGTADKIIGFSSTSKISFAGAGIGFITSSEPVLEAIEKRLGLATIGPDKVNQLRHAKLLTGRIREHMQKHASLVKPKFEAVERGLQNGLGNTNVASWTQPKGGYFVSLDTQPGLAKEVIDLSRNIGVALTPAGATFPYNEDPEDKNIRIAPTFASIKEIETAIDALTLCIRLADLNQVKDRNGT